MGLDSYLSAKKHVSNYSFSSEPEKQIYNSILGAVGVEDKIQKHTPSAEIKLTVGYWRKANSIHSWFVNNCQDGRDDCKSYYVPREQLENLRGLCKEVIETKNTSLLETKGGFFFGSPEYNEWYFKDLENTVEQLDSILNNPKFDDWSFEYQSSW